MFSSPFRKKVCYYYSKEVLQGISPCRTFLITEISSDFMKLNQSVCELFSYVFQDREDVGRRHTI